MIIKSIEIQNFLSYYDLNQLKFDSDSTIIIGQNNTGKSKLFDAYNWVLYNEAYKTEEEEWRPTFEWGDELANKLAKKECAISSWLTISVCLNFEDDNNNSYTVTRDYRIQKVGVDSWVKSSDSELVISKRSATTYNTNHFYGQEAILELNRFFPKNLSRYFLFQGEGISQLLRLNQRSHFTKAINEMSGIKYFAKASRYANNVYAKLKYEFESKDERDAEVQKAKLDIAGKIVEVLDKLSDFDIKLENEYKERDIRQQKLDEKIEELSRYEECGKLLQEIKHFESELIKKQDQRKQLFESNRNNLFDLWLYSPVRDQFSNFLSLYRKGKEEQKIPEPIRQDFIQQMLQENVCKVCGTIAPKGSDAFKHIMQHINERSLDKEVAAINTLSDTADIMNVALELLPESVEEFRSQLQVIQEELNSLRENIDYKEEELRIVIERIEEEKHTTLNRNDIEKVNLVQLKKDIDQTRVDLSDSKDKIAQLIGRKEETDKVYKDLIKEEEKLVLQSSNDIERRRMLLAKRISEHADRLHKDFLGRLLRDIEQEANDYFISMTRNNTALSGAVRVDYNNQEVYIVDEQGRRMSNINQANKVSLQISFVAAVLSVSNKIWDNHFPFVADAPISALGGNNKLSAIKTMIDIFKQSIIILKDDASIDNIESVKSDEVRQLIERNSKIRHAYELKMSSGSSSEEQYTEIKILK
ncbi:AAA family ATPase [Flavobacterium sp.]|uniref:AAA family ATPase n=1 Tax=Flavobacterium sp. TaxID=239 RepID=UPI00391CC168